MTAFPIPHDPSMSKKTLKNVIATGGDLKIHDPSIVDTYTGSLRDRVADVGVVYLTNHPKRTWFARVTQGNSNLKVE